MILSILVFLRYLRQISKTTTVLKLLIFGNNMDTVVDINTSELALLSVTQMAPTLDLAIFG